MFIKKSALLVICSLVLCALVTNQIEGMQTSPQSSGKYTFKSFTRNFLQAVGAACIGATLYECYKRPDQITKSWEYIKNIPVPIQCGIVLAGTYGILKASKLTTQYNKILQQNEQIQRRVHSINPHINLADRVSTLELSHLGYLAETIRFSHDIHLVTQWQRNLARRQTDLQKSFNDHLEDARHIAERTYMLTQKTCELSAQYDAFYNRDIFEKRMQSLENKQNNLRSRQEYLENLSGYNYNSVDHTFKQKLIEATI